MRKITANYIFPVSSAPLKNGIIVLDDKNKIIDIIDTKNKFKEIENLEFYSGVIVPGFVDAFTLLSYSNFLGKDFTDCISGDFYSNLSAKISIIKADLQSVQRAINHLEAYGTKAALDLYPHPDCSPQKMKSKIYFSDSNRNLSLGLDEQEENSNSFTLINRYTLKENSILPKTSNHICIGTGSLGTHQKLSVFEEMKWIQARFSDLTVWEIIKWTCLNAAKFLNIDNVFGSLEIGKSPGLNIVSGIDFTKQQLSNEAELKVLI